MKRVSSSITLLFIIFFFPGTSGSAFAVDKSFALSVGGTGFTSYDGKTDGIAEEIRIEKKAARQVAFYAQIRNIEYRHGNGFYAEWGRGILATLGMNLSFYNPVSDFEGWYVGFGISAGSVRGHWEDDRGTPFVTSGSGSSTIIGPNVHLGYKRYLGSREVYYIEPRVEADLLASIGTLGGLSYSGPQFNAGLSAGVAW